MDSKDLEISTVYHLSSTKVNKEYLARRIKAIIPAMQLESFIKTLPCSEEDKQFYLNYTWEYMGE